MQKQLQYKDIILRPNKSNVNSRNMCDISTYIGTKKYASPVCCANMQSLLTPEICKIFDDRNWFYVYHRINGVSDVENFVKTANIEKWKTVSISIGIGDEWCNLINRLNIEGLTVDSFTIDVALSHNNNIIVTINKVKEKYPNAYLTVGNGCTPEWINWLEDFGVNCAKIGIGTSASCRTRQYTGFGSTTVSSLLECVDAAKTIDIMSDGGLTIDKNGEVWIGDVNKALSLGADFVMSGALFSKCLNSPAIINGYYGNASEKAKGNKTHIEGVTIKIETNGLTISENLIACLCLRG